MLTVDLIKIGAYCGAIASIIAIIMFVYNPIKKIQKNNEKKNDLTYRALRVMLKGSLLNITEQIINQGYITTDELSIVNAQYEVYKELGGNGTITRLVNVATNLRIEKGKGANNDD